MCLGQCLNCGEYGECDCGESASSASHCSHAHTPGPWTVSDADRPGIDGHDDTWSIVIYGGDADDPEIGIQGRTTEERKANARLIAAAPELLDACKSFLDMWHRAGPLGSHQFEKFDSVVRQCGIAVDKATGEVV